MWAHQAKTVTPSNRHPSVEHCWPATAFDASLDWLTRREGSQVPVVPWTGLAAASRQNLTVNPKCLIKFSPHDKGVY